MQLTPILGHELTLALLFRQPVCPLLTLHVLLLVPGLHGVVHTPHCPRRGLAREKLEVKAEARGLLTLSSLSSPALVRTPVQLADLHLRGVGGRELVLHHVHHVLTNLLPLHVAVTL